MATTPHQRLHRVVVDGVGVAVAFVQGSATSTITLAWIHGLGGSSSVGFAEAARHPALSEVTSLLIDLPGFGRSSHPGDWGYTIEDHAAIVLEVLSRTVEGPVALFGHSMGGSVAILCAAQAPAAFQRLIVAEPNLEAGGGPTSALIASQTEAEYVARGHDRLLRATRLHVTEGGPGLAAWLETMRLAAPFAVHRSATSLVAERAPSFGEVSALLTLPRAIIAGEHSDDGVRIAGVPAYLVPEAGHNMMVDNPAGFVEVLVAALQPPVAPRFC